MTMLDFDSLTRPQIVTNGDTARTRKTAPITSHRAADASAKTVSRSHGWVLGILAEKGPLSQPELIDLARETNTPISESRVRSAVSELVEDGAVEFTGYFHQTRFGNPTQVWQLTGGDAA